MNEAKWTEITSSLRTLVRRHGQTAVQAALTEVIEADEQAIIEFIKRRRGEDEHRDRDNRRATGKDCGDSGPRLQDGEAR